MFDLILLSRNYVGRLFFDKLKKSHPHLKLKSILLKTNFDIDALNSLDSQIFVLCSENDADYQKFNKYFHQRKKIWTSARLFSNFGELGPFVIPSRTSCFECYRIRELSADAVKRKKLESKNTYFKIFSEILANFLLLEIVKILSNKLDTNVYDSVREIDFDNNVIRQHPVLKVPNCEVCGV